MEWCFARNPVTNHPSHCGTRSVSAVPSGFAGEARQKRKRHWIYPYGAYPYWAQAGCAKPAPDRFPQEDG